MIIIIIHEGAHAVMITPPHWKCTQWPEFKSWMELFSFHIVLIPLGKVWIQLFFPHKWENSKSDRAL